MTLLKIELYRLDLWGIPDAGKDVTIMFMEMKPNG
jgi:hypothetical protein